MRTKIELGGLRINALRSLSLRGYPWRADACENGSVISPLRQRGLSVANKVYAAAETLEMPVRMKLPVLPVYYYHDHFTEMLFFVSEVYGPVLNERHRAFIKTFQALSKDAQCLLIRMINRRGRTFRHGAFRYAEIADAQAALEELRNCSLVRAIVEGDYADFIVCHAKEALIKGGKDAGLADIRTSWAKAKLIKYFLENVAFQTAHDHCGGGEFVALGDTEPVEFMLYLYFGKTEDDLKNFALGDLGIIRTNEPPRVCRRLQLLRGWSHDKQDNEQVLA
jgi:DNA polymerase III subunit epsilon